MSFVHYWSMAPIGGRDRCVADPYLDSVGHVPPADLSEGAAQACRRVLPLRYAGSFIEKRVRVDDSPRISSDQGKSKGYSPMRGRNRTSAIESLEVRRLLAQAPQAITDYGGRCGDDVVYSASPGVAYFRLSGNSCFANNGEPKIYRTDGTVAGTYELGPIGTSDSISTPIEVGTDVYFSTKHWNAAGAGAFHRSDGTPNGTIILSAEAVAWEFNGALHYVPLVLEGGSFREGETELRRTTGATDEKVREIGNVSSFARAGDVVLFTVDRDRREVEVFEGGGSRTTVIVERELWSTDGTTDGTTMLADRDADALMGGEFNNGRAWYTAFGEDGTFGVWSTNGTPERTFRLEISESRLTERFGDYYLVEPYAESGPRTLQATDGLTVVDLVELSGPVQSFIINLGDELYFEADGQLWNTDGSKNGTRAVMELGSGVGRELRFGDPFHGGQHHATEGYFYFEQAEPAGLFRVDRTTGDATQVGDEPATLRAGTGRMLVYRVDSDPVRDLVLIDDAEVHFEFADLGVTMSRPLLELSDEQTLLFEGESELEGAGYWLSDGTKHGTYKVSEFARQDAVFSETSDFFQVGSSIIFDAVAPDRLGEGRMFSFKLDGANALPGDIDGNGVVEFSDFLLLAASFGQSDVPADIDQDGAVTLGDFFLLKNNFGKSATTAWP